MAGESAVPQSPETQPPHVREELDQTGTSHDGSARAVDDPTSDSASGFGAVETENTPVMAPMRSPDELVTDETFSEAAFEDVEIDPADEITPG